MRPTITCFLIDDDADDQEIFAMALARVSESIECVVANDGREALEKLQADQTFIPHLVFVDLNMPRMNGKQCLKELRRLQHLREVPIIIYSTSSEPRDIKEAKETGASDYLTKQSSIGGLVRMLEQVFQKYNYIFNPA
jgi:CheY-like chemotaxis protein